MIPVILTLAVLLLLPPLGWLWSRYREKQDALRELQETRNAVLRFVGLEGIEDTLHPLQLSVRQGPGKRFPICGTRPNMTPIFAYGEEVDGYVRVLNPNSGKPWGWVEAPCLLEKAPTVDVHLYRVQQKPGRFYPPVHAEGRYKRRMGVPSERPTKPMGWKWDGQPAVTSTFFDRRHVMRGYAPPKKPSRTVRCGNGPSKNVAAIIVEC